eukprot:234968-Prymnesium_polylepis.1
MPSRVHVTLIYPVDLLRTNCYRYQYVPVWGPARMGPRRSDSSDISRREHGTRLGRDPIRDAAPDVKVLTTW